MFLWAGVLCSPDNAGKTFPSDQGSLRKIHFFFTFHLFHSLKIFIISEHPNDSVLALILQQQTAAINH